MEDKFEKLVAQFEVALSHFESENLDKN